MTHFPRTTTPQQDEAQAYLNDVYSSWHSLDYIQDNGLDMLVLNLAMTPDAAQDALNDWMKVKRPAKR